MIRKMVTIFSLAMGLAVGVPQLASAHGGFGGGFSGGHFGGGGFGAGAHFSGAHVGGGSFGASDHFSTAHVGVNHFGSGDHFARGHFDGRHFAFRRHGRDFFFFDGPYDEGYYDGYDYDDDACYERVETRRGLRWVWICD